jgi:hypothetical protein
MPGKAGAARNRGTAADGAAQAVKKASAAATAALVAAALGIGKGAATDQAATAAVALQPGQWEMVTQIRSLEIPGAPAEVQARVRRQVSQAQTKQDCITPEEARDPLPQMRRMVTQSGGPSCQFTDQVFGGGVIRIGATCPGPGGQGSQRMSMVGSFTATTMQMTIALDTQGAAAMSMTAGLRGRRIGDCPASPAPPTP